MNMFTKSLLNLSALVIILNIVQCEYLSLKQVVILSRHNVRTPLSKTLWQYSPKPWPVWKEKSGYLTKKGELLESYMGEYFVSWLKQEALLSEHCPTEEDFYVYANTQQRTLASAQAFVRNGFPNCSVVVHHANNSDPIFNPFIHNDSATFMQDAVDKMNTRLKRSHLNTSYELLEDILEYSKSVNCIENKQCNLVTDVNKPYVKMGNKPNIVGPLKISKSAVDSFLMENYEGLEQDKVAWGSLTDNKWNTVMELSRSYHNIIFNSTPIAKDISHPLIKYLTTIFINKSPKVALVMGHDANVYTVLTAMGFKPYELEGQYEEAPVGGKVVFQKWVDEELKEYLKVHYVYQCTEQMRDGVKLTSDNPPTFKSLELNECKTGQNGFCPWEDFMELLYSL